VSVVVSKAEDKVVDFGEKHGQVIDDAVQMQIKVNGKVIAETKVGTTAEAERHADKLLAKVTDNAKKVGGTAQTDTVTHGGKDVHLEVVHDGFGGYHGEIQVTDADGLTHHLANGVSLLQPHDFETTPKQGEFKSPEQAMRVLNKRAEKFAQQIVAMDKKYAADAAKNSEANDGT